MLIYIHLCVCVCVYSIFLLVAELIVIEPLYFDTNLRDDIFRVDSDNYFDLVVKSTQGELTSIGGEATH